jgi:hypothetical protein
MAHGPLHVKETSIFIHHYPQTTSLLQVRRQYLLQERTITPQVSKLPCLQNMIQIGPAKK